MKNIQGNRGAEFNAKLWYYFFSLHCIIFRQLVFNTYINQKCIFWIVSSPEGLGNNTGRIKSPRGLDVALRVHLKMPAVHHKVNSEGNFIIRLPLQKTLCSTFCIHFSFYDRRSWREPCLPFKTDNYGNAGDCFIDKAEGMMGKWFICIKYSRSNTLYSTLLCFSSTEQSGLYIHEVSVPPSLWKWKVQI